MPIDVPMRFEEEELLWTVDGVCSPAERADFFALIESSSPALATNNPLYRDQDRVIHDDPPFRSSSIAPYGRRPAARRSSNTSFVTRAGLSYEA